MNHETKDWLEQEVPPEEVEKNPDGSIYQPIRVIEHLLDSVSNKKWDRLNHKYSFHTDKNGEEWLATSHELKIQIFGYERFLICSSLIKIDDYQGVSNILQTGISEATKAGVKVLGKRFGRDLNVQEKKKDRIPVKRKPDAKVIMAYEKAIISKNDSEISRLEGMYTLKMEDSHVEA